MNRGIFFFKAYFAQNYRMSGHTIDSVAEQLHSEITKDEEKRLETQIGLQRICVLGNHQEHGKEMLAIATKLCKKNYPATIIKKIPGGVLPDFEKESKILDRAELLLVIDSDKGGLVGESTYLLQNSGRIRKSVLLVPDSVSDDDFFCTKKHYVYYISKHRYSTEKLVRTAVLVAMQASHNLAVNEIRKQPCNSNGLKKL